MKFGHDKVTRQLMTFDLADVGMLNPGEYYCFFILGTLLFLSLWRITDNKSNAKSIDIA